MCDCSPNGRWGSLRALAPLTRVVPTGHPVLLSCESVRLQREGSLQGSTVNILLCSSGIWPCHQIDNQSPAPLQINCTSNPPLSVLSPPISCLPSALSLSATRRVPPDNMGYKSWVPGFPRLLSFFLPVFLLQTTRQIMAV